MPGHHDRATGISQPAGLEQVPAFHQTIEKPGAESIAGSQNIGDLDRIAGHIHVRQVLPVNPASPAAGFVNDDLRPRL